MFTMKYVARKTYLMFNALTNEAYLYDNGELYPVEQQYIELTY